MKLKIATLLIASSLMLGACDTGKDDVIRDIKIDMSMEYNVPISDVKVETIDYGITKLTTNQFEVTVESKGISFYLVDTEHSNDFRRIPLNK